MTNLKKKREMMKEMTFCIEYRSYFRIMFLASVEHMYGFYTPIPLRFCCIYDLYHSYMLVYYFFPLSSMNWRYHLLGKWVWDVDLTRKWSNAKGKSETDRHCWKRYRRYVEKIGTDAGISLNSFSIQPVHRRSSAITI